MTLAGAEDGGLPLEDWKRIDAVCDRFEAAARAGGRPDPAAFLQGLEGPARDRLLRELLEIDLATHLDRGERPDALAYRVRFPEHLAAIDEVFALGGQHARTFPSPENHLRNCANPPASAAKLATLGTELPRAELNSGVLEALRSEGYLVLGELGRGGMGVVYLARKVALNRLCALKMVLAGVHAGGAAVARFRAEAEAIARLRHPDIVQIYHVGQADGLPYLELEYLPGGGLDQTLDGSPRAARAAAELVEIIALAIAEAHRQGIVHRDLKPANILLDSSGRPKVADFGLAKMLDSEDGLTKSRAVLGSPSYMAPEQAHGDASSAGATSDVYALGAILYELLTGRPPFRAATALETLALVKEIDPVLPSRFQPGLQAEIETICMKCLEKTPARRYTTALELAEELRRFLAGEPILARPAPYWERTWKWARRRPALAAALSVTTGAIVLLLGGAFYYNAQLRASVRQARAAESAAIAAGRRTLKNLNQLVFDAQEKLGKTPATRLVRKELLDTALEGLDEIAASTATAAPNLERAVAHQKLGDIFREIGRTSDAAAQYEFARGLALALGAGTPQDLALAGCLSRTFAGLGELSLNESRIDDAIQHLRRVVDLADTTEAINPNKQGAQHARLDAYFRLGRAYSFGRHLDAATVWFRKMHDLAARWSALEPANTEARDLLSTAHRKLADVLKLAGDNAAARAEYESAVALGNQLILVEPANSEFKLHLALALDDMAMVLRRLGALPEAAPPSRQAERLFGELVQADPDDIDNRLRFLQTQHNYGCLEMDGLDLPAAAVHLRAARDGLLQLERAGKLAGRPRDKAQLLPAFEGELAACEAVAASPGNLAALKLRPPGEVCRLLRIRIGVLAAQGHSGELASAAEALLGMDASGPADLYALGRSLAWCASYFDPNSRAASSLRQHQDLKLRFVDRAIAILVRAADDGVRNSLRLRDDAALASLREHPRFQALTQRLAAPGS